MGGFGFKKPVAAVLACVFTLACGKSDEKPEGAPSGERTKEPVPEVPKDAPTGPFAAFDFAAAKQAWQGAWVLEGSVVWMVQGDRVRIFDGQSERELGFAVYSPCQVTTTDEAAGETTYTNFVFVGEQLHAGLGSSGTVVGDAVIVCDGGKTWVLTGDKCEAWSEMFDDWKGEPATCRVEGEGAERQFVQDDHVIPFLDPTSLGTEQIKRNVAQKHADFDSAKAALASAG
jgi:hypothetical protein